MSDALVVALVGGGFSVLVALIEVTRRQNNNDHASNASKLDRVIDKLEQVDSRVTGHIAWHAHRDD